MSGGLAALLDDVATLAKMAAASVDDVSAAAGKASAKAVGVVVDDTAVTPRYVHGLEPSRELPIICRITKGSLRNKLVFILPVAILLSIFAPWALTPLLMIGGAYLSYEGAEKIIEHFSHRPAGTHEGTPERTASDTGADAERRLVSGAIRTDFILSAEIMVIALGEVADQTIWIRLGSLAIVAVIITALVYGVVGLIVKMDDIGLALARRPRRFPRRFGLFLVSAMPRVLTVLSYVGTIAMLWVGGHILISGIHDLGWTAPHDVVSHLITAASPFGWFVDTAASTLAGFIVGCAILLVIVASRFTLTAFARRRARRAASKRRTPRS